MRYDFQRVALDIPHVLLDETTYSFDDAESGRSLLASSRPIQEQIDPDEVLGPVVEQVQETYGPDAQVVSDGRATLLGDAARKVVFRVKLSGGSLGIWILASGGKTQVSIKLIASQPSASDDAQFEHVVRSVAPAERPWVRKGAAGYVRRQAGRITLEVPRELQIPATYTFATADSSLRVRLFYGQTAEVGRPDFSSLIYLDDPAESLRVTAEEETQVRVDGWSGTDSRWDLDRMREEELVGKNVVRRLALRLAAGSAFHIRAVASDSGIRVLDSVWPQLLGTVGRGA